MKDDGKPDRGTSLFFRRRFPVVVSAAVLLLFLSLEAAAGVVIPGDGVRHVSVDSGVSYFFGSEEISAIRAASDEFSSLWLPLEERKLPEAASGECLWLRLPFTYASGSDESWFLEVGWRLIDRIDVHLYNEDLGAWEEPLTGGELVPGESRRVEYRRALFPLELTQGGRYSAYIRIESTGRIYWTLDFWETESFRNKDQVWTLLLGVSFGVLAIMFFYNLFLYFFIKVRNLLVFSLFVFSVILYELVATGIGGLYLWDGWLWLKRNGYLIFASSSYMMATLFFRNFLHLKDSGGLPLKLADGLLAVWILFVALSFTPINFALIPVMVALSAASLGIGAVVSVYLWIKGSLRARYYTIAHVFLYAGTAMLTLEMNGLLPRRPITEYGQMVGFAVEFVLLSVALADLVNKEKAQREIAQKQALELSNEVNRANEEKLAIQEDVLALQRRNTEELERMVADRTDELERALEDLESLNRELSDLSITDPLTKLPNRRRFDLVLAEELKRSSRNGSVLSLALADIDHFKSVNDTFGHLVGDDCLRLVAETLRGQLGRSGDFVARFGGEEFAVILPETSPENAIVVAERAREAVEGLDFTYAGEHVPLRVSIGLAGWVADKDESPERLVLSADEALYRAKREGRNRVAAAE